MVEEHTIVFFVQISSKATRKATYQLFDKELGSPPTIEAAEMRRAAMAPAVSAIWIVPNSLNTKSFSPKSLRSEVPECKKS